MQCMWQIFVSKIDKIYLGDQFHQFKNPRWLYCKIETLRSQFANNPNLKMIMHFGLKILN